MSLLKINAVSDQPVLEDGADLRAVLRENLTRLAPQAPVVVLIPGYKFSPHARATIPHEHILSLSPPKDCWKAISWPRHLGFGRGPRAEGLCIAFGWEARGSIWRAWNTATKASLALAQLVDLIESIRPGPIDLISHSLGARVALGSFRHLPAHSYGRAVLLSAAEYQSTARAALHTECGRSAEVFNITSRENDLFDWIIEWLVRGPCRGDQALGSGLGQQMPNWLDIQVDDRATRWALQEFGYRIPRPDSRVSHWSAYLRPGLFAFYRDLIRARHDLPLACLRHVLPQQNAPRWSRLLRRPDWSLPFLGRSSMQ